MSTSTQTQSSPNVADIKGVHPSAVGSNTMPDATKTQPPNNESTNKESVEADHIDSTYPEQKHAGKVGLGPNYNQGAGFLDKVTGLKEEIKGKVTKNPELVTKGHDRFTGELKHKELEEDGDPFAIPEEKTAEPGASGTGTDSATTNGTAAHQPSQAAAGKGTPTTAA
ncbi:hypothetical protein DFH09DRAFT_903476 [Mycena vulgaris]|nr:hypothetical protein DFH09DRAFT_903476 [Mycena vulgaris]